MAYRTVLAIIFLLLLPQGSNAQDERLQITGVKPLYCFDIVEGSDKHVVKIYNYECADRLQITFQNSDMSRVRNVLFTVTVREANTSHNRILYRGKHRIDVKLEPEEVVTYDLVLPNPIAPPEGEKDFSNREKWKWEAEILSINMKK